MSPNRVVDCCPLCGERGRTTVFDIEYAGIWRDLAQVFGVRVDDAIVRALTPAERTTLHRCTECALEYFSPAVAGDEAFYRALDSQHSYFEDEKWEFPLAARTVSGADAVLEFGCGRGRFLQHLRGHVAKPVGLDLNPEAVAQVREQGFEASNASLEQFASEHTAAFDAVCAFHTIEHLPSVPEFLSPAQRCLTPGGRILISVPNRRRLVRRNDEPLDCPPHHISRWEAPQFEYIARRFSMELVSVTFEEPDFTAIAERWLQRGRRVFVPIAGERRGEWLARAYRKLTMGQRIYNASARVRRFTRGGQFGHAMLAVFRSR